MAIEEIKEFCPQTSIKVCPVGALSQQGYNAPVVDKESVKCVSYCPMGAFSIE